MNYQRIAVAPCKNMNHGRSNVRINFCPECGKRFQAHSVTGCNSEKHMNFRKQRFNFCIDCGKKLHQEGGNGKR